MKFREHLHRNAVPEWRFSSVDYVSLASFLRKNTESGQWDDNLEAKFIVMLEEEFKKVSDFSHVKFDELARRVQFVERDIKRESENIQSLRESGEDLSNNEKLQGFKKELDEITSEVAKLSRYNTLNYTSLVKILKKHDKYTDHLLHHTFMAILANHPFYKMYFDPIIASLSRLYSKIKPVALDEGKGKTKKERTSHMFWVHVDNVTDVKLYILQNLPVYSSKQDPSQPLGALVSSIYFDNSQLELYHQRTEKADTAQSVRVSWYGVNPSEVSVERKVHTNYWTGDQIRKERFSLKTKAVAGFVAGTYRLESKEAKMIRDGKTPQQARDIITAAASVQSAFVDKELTPCVRVCHSRTAFEHSTYKEVRITLDTDVTLIKETQSSIDACLHDNMIPPYKNVRAGDITRFPYAVLNVKLQTSAEALPPAWVDHLMRSHLVESVPCFSPYIHGVSVLYEEHLRVLPFWHIQMERDIRRSPTSSIQDRIKQGLPPPPLPTTISHEVVSISTPHRLPDKPIAVPVRVEPKVFFANERTFLNWMHTAILVATMSISLLNIATPANKSNAAVVAGYTLTPVALVFLGYSAYTYYWRDYKIRTRDPGPYNTVVGPVIITAVFVFTLFLNYSIWLGEHGLDWLWD